MSRQRSGLAYQRRAYNHCCQVQVQDQVEFVNLADIATDTFPTETFDKLWLLNQDTTILSNQILIIPLNQQLQTNAFTLTNNGIINVFGNIRNGQNFDTNTQNFKTINNATINIFSTGSIVAIDNISNQFINNGIVNNGGFVTIQSGGVGLNNAGAIINNTGTIQNNIATITNNGTIQNKETGILFINSDEFFNNSIINNSGGNLVFNNSFSVFTNNGIFFNNNGGRINNTDGVFTNNGTIHNGNSVCGEGIIDVPVGGTIDNSCP
jgi:hypothetical protein